jgi:hypothetical protein
MSFNITQIPTTRIVTNPIYPYYSNTVKWGYVTINQNTYLNLTANGTPLPAKAGNNPEAPNGGFTNQDVPIIWFGNPYILVDQKYDYNIVYRGGTDVENPEKTELGIQGMFANGVALYSPSSGLNVPGLPGLKYTDTVTGSDHEFNAIFFEDYYAIDAAGGHCSPQGAIDASGNPGQYHYHDDMFLSGDTWNNDDFIGTNTYFSSDYYTDPSGTPIRDHTRHPDGHSKILGVCFDGYPVYGPYGYTDTSDISSNVITMTSSYQENLIEFTGRPYTYDQYYNNPISGVSQLISVGAYLDDHTYVQNHGTLDEYNGRYGVTPEYPGGTYAYFTTGSLYPYIIGNFSKNQRVSVTNEDVACFKEDSKILCFKDEKEIYVKIQEIRKGDLIKTINSGYIPVNMIGTTKIYNSGNDIKNPNKLYKCTPNKYPSLFEDLYITGHHSILVDNITEYEKKNIIDLTGDIYVTDNKYRLMACLDEKTETYDVEGFFNIWHLALENDNYYMNYGIYANGLIVETSSKRYLKELSGMKLIE